MEKRALRYSKQHLRARKTLTYATNPNQTCSQVCPSEHSQDQPRLHIIIIRIEDVPHIQCSENGSFLSDYSCLIRDVSSASLAFI